MSSSANTAARLRSSCVRPLGEGKANAALMRFLAEQLQVPRQAIVLERGRTSRNKLIRIDGLSDEDVRCRLLSAV